MQRVNFQVRVGVFKCQQILAKISFVIFDNVIKKNKQTNWMWFSVALMKFHWSGINWQSECRNCCLYIIIKKIASQAKSGKYFQIWFFPRFRGKKWRRSEHAHASYPGLFFRPPGFSPYMGWEERRVQELDYIEWYISELLRYTEWPLLLHSEQNRWQVGLRTQWVEFREILSNLTNLTAQVELSDSTKCGHSKFGITVLASIFESSVSWISQNSRDQFCQIWLPKFCSDLTKYGYSKFGVIVFDAKIHKIHLWKLWNASFVEQKRLKRKDTCYNNTIKWKDNYGGDNPS